MHVISFTLKKVIHSQTLDFREEVYSMRQNNTENEQSKIAIAVQPWQVTSQTTINTSFTDHEKKMDVKHEKRTYAQM